MRGGAGHGVAREVCKFPASFASMCVRLLTIKLSFPCDCRTVTLAFGTPCVCTHIPPVI